MQISRYYDRRSPRGGLLGSRVILFAATEHRELALPLHSHTLHPLGFSSDHLILFRFSWHARVQFSCMHNAVIVNRMCKCASDAASDDVVTQGASEMIRCCSVRVLRTAFISG